MPDIDPAALSRPSVSSSAPILPPKSLNVSIPSSQKVSKSSHVPPRIDLEPLYTALKSSIGENWAAYKEAISLFVMGQLNQAELSARTDWFLMSQSGDTEHLHNQLIAAIYGNVTREMPDQGVASWVSANDKPTAGAGSKPVNGDAAEQRLKAEVMQLPSRDRRRLKDISLNDADAHDAYATFLGDHRRTKHVKSAPDLVPASAGGLNNLNKTNWDLEIRKRYAQPLALESGEFPDLSNIESRMSPICYENGLLSGHTSDAAQFMSVATETFIKQFLSSVFDKTRSNGPGSGGSAGSGGGASWVTTHKYRHQLEREEEAWLRGEVQRDKSGLLPIEAKAASDRGPLGIADLQTALELGDCGLDQMPIIIEQITLGYREGELESWNDYTLLDGHGQAVVKADTGDDVEMKGIDHIISNGVNNNLGYHDDEDLEVDGWGWEGAGAGDREALNGILDSCLAVGS
ncbi:MAG: transcriptional coactivator hfi1/ADA1 [Claussenomyces sp. TS43310]|nr:MAG: transcriptional coactivator hfi1/ADA1 [Claussenomyces sp. TS43310]